MMVIVEYTPKPYSSHEGPESEYLTELCPFESLCIS